MERDLWEYLKSTPKPIVLYGIGNGADKIIRVLEQKGISFKGIFASNGFVRNKLFHGMPLESYEALKDRYGDMIVLLCFGTHLPNVMENIKRIAGEQELYAPEVPVIGGGLFNKTYYEEHQNEFDEIYNSLADQKSKTTFQNVIKYKISGKIDYLFRCETDFTDSLLSPQGGEVILDLGAYNGDTALEFARNFPDYKKIIAVEPDRKTFKKLTANTSNINIECHNICISDFCGMGSFSMKSGRNSAVGEGDETRFSTVDGLLKGRKVNLIKMDVEGEEVKAIIGAFNTIKSYKPQMTISAYHRTEDFLAIPQEVLKIRDDYKIYMRHFPSIPAWDTVYYFL